MINFLRESSLEDGPKMAKIIKKVGTFKRKGAFNFRVIVARLGPKRVRSLPTSIDIPSKLMENKSSSRPINLDEDVLGPIEPFVVPNISDLLGLKMMIYMLW